MITKIGKSSKYVLAFLATAGLALGAAGCAGGSSDEPDTGTDTGNNETSNESSEGINVETMAIVAPENESDHGWNQMGLVGAEIAAESAGIELISVPDAGYDNTETVLSQVVAEGADFVIAHASGFGVAGTTVANQTGVPMLIGDTGELVPGKVGMLTTAAQEGGYLAGVAAAMTTETNTVGIVVSADDFNWFKMSAGFAEGVYSVNPDIEVLYASVGPAAYGDSAGGKSTAEQLIGAGADVIFGMGDGATTGYLQAVAATDNVMYIASIGDVTSSIDPSRVLTSVLWNFDSSYSQAIEDLASGEFGTREYMLNVGDGSLSLQESDALTDEIMSAIDAAKEQIISGEVVPTEAESADEVRAVIAKN